MFEAAELGRQISKAEFREREPELHTRLLEAQRRLRASSTPVIVIVSGVEGAGKGRVVDRLNEWLDARGMHTVAFWDESDEERERPRLWRFWRVLPPRSTIGIFFGSWYTAPIVDRVFGRISKAAFDRELRRIASLEQMLANDGAVIVKLWFHLSRKEQQKRLRRESRGKAGRQRLSPLTKKFSKRYDEFASVSERAIRLTDTGSSPWHIVDAHDRRYREITAGEIVLAALEEGVAARPDPSVESSGPSASTTEAAERETVLDRVDLSLRLEADEYRQRLRALQTRLHELTWRTYDERISTVAVFEGWDAAGKGGAIRRVTAAIDARLFRVISVAAPSDEERAQHYLWRFWRHLQRAGHVTIYDRSWYGRVLVERVEGFATPAEWRRSYHEINEFEEQLCDHGIVLLKFWLHLSEDEQLRRFEERQRTPWKVHKITDEDWRNRERWSDYESAVHDMVAHTSTEYAPWTLVAAEDKKSARVEVLETLCSRLGSALTE